MYAYFKGSVESITEEAIVLETGNIGYNIIMPSSDISRLMIGDEVKVYTYTSVREDAMWLYGFLEKAELDFYKLLLTVNGVGPKAALGILSGASISDIQVAIIAQDTKALSKLPGIGAKTAGRIILDLKDKVSTDDLLDIVTSDVSTPSGNQSGATVQIKKEATDILTALGYSASEAMRALSKLDIMDDAKVEDIVSEALRLM